MATITTADIIILPSYLPKKIEGTSIDKRFTTKHNTTIDKKVF
jgi:hypothetical protein